MHMREVKKNERHSNTGDTEEQDIKQDEDQTQRQIINVSSLS